MHQVDRIVHILYWLSRGEELTSEDIARRFGQDVRIRDIQRDLARLDELQIGLQCDMSERPYRWSFPLGHKPVIPAFATETELVSLYLLKAYLKTFRGTDIERSASALIRKIDRSAPGDVFAEELMWDQNIGEYDYSAHSDILHSLITAIIRREKAVITYRRTNEVRTNQFTGVIHRLFTFGGVIYAACYVPRYDNYISLSVQHIERIRSAGKADDVEPFDAEKYTAHRFGVFEGEPVEVRLEIRASHRQYFEHRLWHRSQIFSEGKRGALLLTMNVPLAPELINWIAGWGAGIKVVAPDALIQQVRAHHESALKQYP